MKNEKNWYIKYFIIGIFFLLLFIAYQLTTQKNIVPTTELDCLKLGSDERAIACIKLLKSSKPQQEFPISSLFIENTNATNKNNCIEVSGTITNKYSMPAQNIMLRVNFVRSEAAAPFHYEVLSPFQNEGEQIQPNSSKTFTKCLSLQSKNAVKDVQNWLYTVIPYSAKIYEQ